MDTTTQGNWKTTYNYKNVTIIGDSASNPFTAPSPSSESVFLWSSSTTDIRALQRPSSNGRVAASWSSWTSFAVDINFTDQSVHQVPIYGLDWHHKGRAETISVLDAKTNAVLDTRSISNFANGVYLLWNVTGHVKLQITKTGGNNVGDQRRVPQLSLTTTHARHGGSELQAGPCGTEGFGTEYVFGQFWYPWPLRGSSFGIHA